MDSLSYRFDKPAKLQAQALSRAIDDAQVKAKAVAKAGGVKLLPISSVVQAGLEKVGGASPSMKSVALSPMEPVAAEKVAPSTYAAPKEESVSADVVVTFAIERP